MKKRVNYIINAFFILLFLGLVLLGSRVYRQMSYVLTYRPLVREVLQEKGSDLDENLLLAMIYTESKGKVVDILQASESLTGNQGEINDSRDSLRQGVDFLTLNMTASQELGTDYWSAVQAYNYGTAYIDYVADNGGKNTVPLAVTYSREVVAPSLGNQTGASYPFYHPVGLFYGGTSLYRNGGNPYYAKQVAVNLSLVRIVAALER